MPNLLDAAYLGLLAAGSPVWLYRSARLGKYRDGWSEKLYGHVPQRVRNAPCLWFHAVSVGEVLLLRPLLERLSRRRPDWEIVISTTTETGLTVARRVFPDLVTFYAPLDFSWATRRAIERIQPSVLVLVETEIWPNLIRAAADFGARIAVINGRLSDRSHRGYQRIQPWITPTLRRLDLVAAQAPVHAERFADLGVPVDRLTVTGSIKYDGLHSDREAPSVQAARSRLGLTSTDPVFVAGSTMEGEDAACYRAFLHARSRHPNLQYVIVPRHPERADTITRTLEAQGASVWRRSQASAPPEVPTHAPLIRLVDTVGELSAVWGLADLAFVGGSLRPGRGGQNMMEPAAFGASVLFGPHTSNFREAVEALLANDAARVVADEAALAEALIDDLDHPDHAIDRGRRGRRIVLDQRGATDRTIQSLDALIQRNAAPLETTVA